MLPAGFLAYAVICKDEIDLARRQIDPDQFYLQPVTQPETDSTPLAAQYMLDCIIMKIITGQF